jgi:sporulation protein YlmC with PRC-barrel domain
MSLYKLNVSQKKFYRREDLIGKQVINQDGIIIVTVRETGYDTEGKMAIIVSTKDGKEAYYSISEIRGIGDVIVLKEYSRQMQNIYTQPLPQQSVPQQGVICPYCGYQNPPGSIYCMRCGSKLP